jgi:hypothetical protein
LKRDGPTKAYHEVDDDDDDDDREYLPKIQGQISSDLCGVVGQRLLVLRLT